MKNNIMSVIRKGCIAVFVLTMMVIIGNVSVAQAKKTDAITAQSFYRSGNILYYTHPQSGFIYSYNIKTEKTKKIRENEGTIFGYTKLIVKGKYIYALLDKSLGSDGEVVDAEIDRISIDGKKRKTLADHTWNNLSIAGKKLIYNKLVGGKNYDAKMGAQMSMSLNGKNIKSAKNITVVSDKNSPNYGYNNDVENITFSTGKYNYSISDDSKELKRDGKTIYKCSGSDWIPYIQSAYVHGKSVVVIHSYEKKKGSEIEIRNKLVHMDINGKNRKTLSDYIPVG